MEYENLTFVEALERLAEQAGMELPEKVIRKTTENAGICGIRYWKSTS